VTILSRCALCCLLLLPVLAEAAEPRSWKAGVAVRVITPEEPMWMAGYGGRKKPAEGKLTELYVKALALEDADGRKFVLLTCDLVGIPKHLSDSVAAEIGKRHGLPRERILLTCSHTHSGPVLNDALVAMYDMPPEEEKKIGPYTEKLRLKMIDVMDAALKDLKPAQLTHGQGTVRFAMNRRQKTEKGFVIGENPEGPVDHDVPVLCVRGGDGKIRAIVFGYACHNTTLDGYEWCGDWAGYAQTYLEEKNPGAVALFWTGCGADANPMPRRKVELCQKYGRDITDAVNDVLRTPMKPVDANGAASYGTVSLSYAAVPTKEQITADLLSKTFAVRRRAERYQKLLAEGKAIEDNYPQYPIQVWRLGNVYWVALGGEVVVDYARRLKKELPEELKKQGAEGVIWVAGYANDVMAYIPSERVLAEGGYEADTSMIYYGKPSKWAAGLEEKIVGKSKELTRGVTPKR
jgi:hypothetical protein